MTERQILGTGIAAAPLDYDVKPSEVFELLAVNATFDGSASASAYLPCVEVISDAGVTVARHVTGETVAAGGSAEVTFAPFLRGAQASTSGGVTGLERILDGTGTLINAGNSANLPWTHNSGDVLLDLSTPAEPLVIDTGEYALSIGYLVSASPGPIANGAVMYGALIVDDFGLPAGLSNQVPFSNTLGTANGVTVSITRSLDAGTGLHFTAQNLGAGRGKFQLLGFVARLS